MEKRLSSENFAKFPDLLLPEFNSDTSEIVNNFRERIKTFVIDHNWTQYQTWLFPTICAQYGWKCVTNQLLQCETCYSNFSPATSNLNNIALHETFVKNTYEKLKSSHKKHCPWPLTPCPDHYVRMYSVHKEEAYRVFTKRLKSLYSLQTELPLIKDGISAKLGLSEDLCSSLCKISFTLENEFSKSAVILAATGWSKDLDKEVKNKIICVNCQRSVALLLYTSVASAKIQHSTEGYDGIPIANEEKLVKMQNSNNIEEKLTEQSRMSVIKSSSNEIDSKDLDSPVVKRKRFHSFVREPFDPLYEHRSWCPWLIDSMNDVCYVGNNKNNTIPGWQLFINCLLRNIKHSEKSPPVKHETLKCQLRRARDMLESWNSPCAK